MAKNIRVLSGENARAAKDADAKVNDEQASRPTGSDGMFHRYQCDRERRDAGDCDIILPQSLYERIVSHLAADTMREHGGLLLGREIYHIRLKRKTVWITHSLPALRAEGNRIELTFSPDTWAQFESETDQIKQYDPFIKRVGWYHSHPGHGIFLSGKDLNFCETFMQPTSIALVVDPIRSEGGFFVRGANGFRPEAPQGFLELQDQQSKSVVTWKNMKLVEPLPSSRDSMPSEVPPIAEGNSNAPPVATSETPLTIGSETKGERDNETSPPTNGSPTLETPEDVLALRSSQLGTSSLLQQSSRLGVPPWAFILVAVFIPALLAYVTVKSLQAGMNISSLQDVESRIANLEVASQRQFEKTAEAEKTLQEIKKEMAFIGESLLASNKPEATQQPDQKRNVPPTLVSKGKKTQAGVAHPSSGGRQADTLGVEESKGKVKAPVDSNQTGMPSAPPSQPDSINRAKPPGF